MRVGGREDVWLRQPLHQLVLRLTALLLLLYGASSIALDVPLRIACGAMLAVPTLLESPVLWTLICGCVWWVNAADWLWIDNHKYLIGYWSLACALSVTATDPRAVLAWNGRVLVGLVFLLATAWKLFAGEYWGGEFLYFTFLSDPRVEAIGEIVGKLSPADLSQNRLYGALLPLVSQPGASVVLHGSDSLRAFARLTSYWTLAIEGAVAIAFLVGKQFLLSRLRDWLLIAFIISTYFLLPVLGFANVLIVMGIAQSEPKSTARWAYLGLLALLQLARLPWQAWVA